MCPPPRGTLPTPTFIPTFTPTPTNTPVAVIPPGETWRFYYFAGAASSSTHVDDIADGGWSLKGMIMPPQLIAMRTATSTTSSLVYFLGDHLGSTSITVNPDGSKAAEIRYKACPPSGVMGQAGYAGAKGGGACEQAQAAP